MADLPKPLPASEWQHDMWTADQLRAYATQAVAQERDRSERDWRARLDVEIARRLEIERRFHSLLESVASKEALLPRTVVLHTGSPSPQPAPDSKPTRVEYLLRRLLAHRMAGVRGYYDDGELQDTTMHPFIDFLRDHPKDIELKLGERGRAAAAPQPPSTTATTGYAQVIDGPKEPGLEWDDSACPTCGEDGGTSCGMPNCGLLQNDEAPQPPSAWRPIEEAPRDGTTVLLAAPGRVTAGEWHAEQWPTASEYHGTTGEYLGQHETGECVPAGWYSWDGGFTDENPPTHWQPLPPPPSAGEDSL